MIVDYPKLGPNGGELGGALGEGGGKDSKWMLL
jgi:hypothetical protein